MRCGVDVSCLLFVVVVCCVCCVWRARGGAEEWGYAFGIWRVLHAWMYRLDSTLSSAHNKTLFYLPETMLLVACLRVFY